MDWVYMLECGDGSLYTGWTNDLARRLAAHQSGRGAKYTRGRAPVRLVYAEQCTDKSAALRREAAVKIQRCVVLVHPQQVRILRGVGGAG